MTSSGVQASAAGDGTDGATPAQVCAGLAVVAWASGYRLVGLLVSGIGFGYVYAEGVVKEQTAAAEKEAAASRAAAEKAAAAYAAAVADAEAAAEYAKTAGLRKLDAWLHETCTIDDKQRRTDIMDLFLDPRYEVNSTVKLFALEGQDIEEILAPLPLATRRLVTRAVKRAGGTLEDDSPTKKARGDAAK
mmetsp:Transcript_30971/g.73594  ORF Transcript_30971/g.73594 Transcript_30971/m.73594 type:complete len:190 (+) Transcript_30971:188-757(+)